MGNPLIKPGGWPADVATLTGSEAKQLDEAQAVSLDGSGGGSYEPTSDINVTDGAGGAFGNIDVHGQLHYKGDNDPRSTYNVGGSIPVTNNQNLGISGGQIRRFADHGTEGAKDHDMDNTGAVIGDWVEYTRFNDGGTNNITLHKGGSGYTGPSIVTFLPGFHVTARLYFDGTQWRLGMHSLGASAGADA